MGTDTVLFNLINFNCDKTINTGTDDYSLIVITIFVHASNTDKQYVWKLFRLEQVTSENESNPIFCPLDKSRIAHCLIGDVHIIQSV